LRRAIVFRGIVTRMLSLALAVLLAFFWAFLELQGRRKHGLFPTSLKILWGIGETPSATQKKQKAKFFALSICLLFAIWEGGLWYLYSFDHLAVQILRVLGFFSLIAAILLRYQKFYWSQNLPKSYLGLREVFLIFAGFCAISFAPITFLFLGIWIFVRFR